MADLCCEYSFAGLTINEVQEDTAAPTDRLVVLADGIVGLDGRPIRRQVDPRGQTDGGIVFGAKYGPRIIAWNTQVKIGTVEMAPNDAYFAAVMDFQNTVRTALEAVLNTPTPLTWTDSGGTAGSVTCVYGIPDGHVQFPGSMMDCRCTFTLVEASEIID